MNNKLYKQRLDLIIDYISQILVYGSNIDGSISISNNEFDDGKFLILTVSVIKNSYFRWHDLGIPFNENITFSKYVIPKLINKFKKFDIVFNDNFISISSRVNNNKVDINFTLTSKKEKNMFLEEKELFYNSIK